MPDELTSVGRVLHLPPIPQVPEPFRGKSFGMVEAAFIGDEADGAELLRPLRELDPVMDTDGDDPRRRRSASCTWTRPTPRRASTAAGC